MGGDNTVKIISMNSVKRGMNGWSPSNQSSYLRQLIEGSSPDICFLPGDNGKRLGDNLVIGYSDYCTTDNGTTVLLYDNAKVQMTRPGVSFNSFGQFPALDIDKLVTPVVQVYSPRPRSMVKDFVMVSWKTDLFTHDNVKVLKSVLKFSQRLALSTQKSVFIGGEIPLPFTDVQSIVKHESKEGNGQFLETAHADLASSGFLPSMTKGSTVSQRHKIKMQVLRCETNSSQSEPLFSDCFIASKELQLTDARMLKIEEVLGREVTMEALKKCAPIETGIRYENRPPRHYGG